MHKTSLAREKQGELFSLIAELDPAAIQALLWSHRPALPPAPTAGVRTRVSSGEAEQIPALAADHDSSPGRLKEESGERSLPRPGSAAVQIR